MFMSDESERPKLAEIVWEGDSKEVLRSFPEAVMQNFGFELWQLQQGDEATELQAVAFDWFGRF